MLKKKERLTKKEFDRFFSVGRRRQGTLLTLIHSPSEVFHGAVVVGKKVHKRAVDRNKLRRRLYNILYRLSREDGLQGTYIVLTKLPAAQAPFENLKEELGQVVRTVVKN